MDQVLGSIRVRVDAGIVNIIFARLFLFVKQKLKQKSNMKTPSNFLASIAFVICGLFAASIQSLQAQKEALPVVTNLNANKNNNQKPPPAPVVKKVVPRRVVKAKVKVEAVTPVPKQMFPPVQRRIEQPKLPAGMKRMGPGAASNEMRNLAKLKLMPPMRRKGNAAASSFPSIGETSLDKLDDRIRDIVIGQAARGLKEIGEVAGFADLLGATDGPKLDFGLGGEGESSGFADPEELAGSGGGSSRSDGLPKDAPPSGWGAWGGLANNGSVDVSTDENGVETKTVIWFESNADDGTTTAYNRSSSTNGDNFASETILYPDGAQRRSARSEGGDGVNSQSIQVVDAEGNGFVDTYTRQTDGNVFMVRQPVNNREIGTAGDGFRVTGSHVPLWLQTRDTRGNPGNDGTTESQKQLADWMWRQHNLGKTTPGGGPKMTTYVNPGDPDYEGAGVGSYPSIGARFSKSIAVNPDPTMMSGGNRLPSARVWRLMQEELKEGATPGINPGSDGRGGR